MLGNFWHVVLKIKVFLSEFFSIFYRFWRALGSILEVFGAYFLFFLYINFGELKFSINLALCSSIVFLVLDGLVGSREALRIENPR